MFRVYLYCSPIISHIQGASTFSTIPHHDLVDISDNGLYNHEVRGMIDDRTHVYFQSISTCKAQ